MVLLPYFVDLTVDLDGARSWWRHQIYWDQKTRTARPVGFAASGLIRALPFALLYAAFRLFDSVGVAVLLGAIAVRLGTAAGMALVFRDGAGLRAPWLLPLRGLTGLLLWVLAMGQRRFARPGARLAP